MPDDHEQALEVRLQQPVLEVRLFAPFVVSRYLHQPPVSHRSATKRHTHVPGTATQINLAVYHQTGKAPSRHSQQPAFPLISMVWSADFGDQLAPIQLAGPLPPSPKKILVSAGGDRQFPRQLISCRVCFKNHRRIKTRNGLIGRLPGIPHRSGNKFQFPAPAARPDRW